MCQGRCWGSAVPVALGFLLGDGQGRASGGHWVTRSPGVGGCSPRSMLGSFTARAIRGPSRVCWAGPAKSPVLPEHGAWEVLGAGVAGAGWEAALDAGDATFIEHFLVDARHDT